MIPAYNTAQYLRVLLDNLLAQTKKYPQTEIVVVDDGSADDMSFLGRMDGIKVVVHEENKGVSAARNDGLKIATGEYITFLDSDDDVVSDYLDIIYADMRSGLDWVSYTYLVDGKKKALFETTEPLMKRMCVWCYAFRREIVDGYWFDETLNTGEDQVWLHEVLKPTHKYKHTKTLTVYYRFFGNVNSIVHRVINGQLSRKRKVKGLSMPHQYKNVFYIKNINAIGGTETFLENIGRKYGGDYDITVFYQTGDPKMIERIKKYLRVKKYRQGEDIRCQKLFCNVNTDILADVVADEYCQVIHVDYKALRKSVKPNTPPEITRFIGVSQNSCDTFEELTGKKVELSYNPLCIEKPRKALRLISATRLSPDKGVERMKILADALDKAGVPYVWDVYTDYPDVIRHENVYIHPPKSNVLDYVAAADYLVQLSSAEGLCYTILESLAIGTPVIVTDIPTNKELGVVDGVNGWVLPLGMESIPIKKIEKGMKKFAYAPPEDRWGEILAKGKGTYEAELKKMRKIVCVQRYYDMQLERTIERGEEIAVKGIRAEHLVDLGLCNYTKEK